MNQLTHNEHSKIYEITQRLGSISSPVLRLQAILQYSQIVDILMLGDTAKQDHDRMWNHIDELEQQVNKYSENEELQTVDSRKANSKTSKTA